MWYINEIDPQWADQLFGEILFGEIFFSLVKDDDQHRSQNANGVREPKDKKRLNFNGLFCGN